MSSQARPDNDAYDDLDHIDAAQILGVNSLPKSRAGSRRKLNTSPKRRKKARRAKRSEEAVMIPTPFDDMPANSDGTKLSLPYKKRKAIRCLTAYGYTPEETAAEIGVTPGTIRKWMGQQEFACMLFAMEKFISQNAMDVRLTANNEIISKLYDEVFERIERGDLKGMSFKDLVEFITKFSNESRLDDKAAVTSRSEVSTNVNVELRGMQERFNRRRINREMYNRKVASRRRPSLPAASSQPKVIEAEFSVVDSGAASG